MTFDVSLREEKNAPAQGIHPLVQAKIAELQGHPKSITFPAEPPDTALAALDYQHFLSLLQDKLNQFGLVQLDHLSLNCDSKAAFQGLSAFIETQGPNLPFKRLSLNLDSLNTEDLSHLTSLIKSLEHCNLEGLILVDTKTQYTEAMAKALLKIVKEHKISVDISLPKHLQKTPTQRALDETTSTQAFESMQQKQFQEFKPVEAKALKAPPRKRPRNTASQGVFIDVEQERQQGYQLERVSQIAKTEESKSESQAKNSSDFYSLKTFLEAYRKGEFTSYSKSFLVDEEQLSDLWMNWVGALTQKEIEGYGSTLISKEACEQLLRFKDHFRYGFDFLEGSPGFRVDELNGLKRIDFDEGLKNTAVYNPLQVRTLEAPEKRALPHNIVQKWLDNTADEHPVKHAWNMLSQDTYDRDAHKIFKQLLPQILTLEATTQKKLLDLCFGQVPCKPQLLKFLLENARQLQANPHFDSNPYLLKTLQELGDEKFASKEFIKNYQETQPNFEEHLLSHLIAPHEQGPVTELLEKAPYLNLNALAQLYLHEGFQGLNKLLEIIQKHPKTFEKVHQQAYQNTSNYLPMLDENFAQALSAIAGFPRNADNEENYWDVLFKEHCRYQAEVDVVDLVNAYKAFNVQIAHLATTNKLPLEFPLTCKLTNIGNLKVFLSRLYTLMNNTSEFNRTAQWAEIEGLDFASRGFIKLSTKPKNLTRCGFFTGEMQFSPNTEAKDDGYTLRANIAVFKKNTQAFGSKEFARDFFRFVSFQKENKEQPLAFYRDLYAKVQKLNCSPDMKKSLLILIASSSTDSSSIRIPAETAMVQADEIIRLLTTGTLGRLTAAAMNIINSLLTLESSPSLIQLVLLLRTITSCPYTKLGDLQAANQKLIVFVGRYFHNVFEGMKHYSTQDYEDKSLFFNHIRSIELLEQKLKLKLESVGDKDSPPNNLRESSKIIALISTFHLTTEKSLDALLSTIDITSPLKNLPQEERAKKEKFTAVMRLLTELSIEDREPLSPDDLITVLNNLKSNPEKPTDVVEMSLTTKGIPLIDYIPKDVLASWSRTSSIPPAVLKMIDEHFDYHQSAQIQKLLKRFIANASEYQSLAQILIDITTPLEPAEKIVFIGKLVESSIFYGDNLNLGELDSPFIPLLKNIAAIGPNEFNNLVVSERDFLKQCTEEQQSHFFVESPTSDKKIVKGLAQKTLAYFTDILPHILEMEEPAFPYAILSPLAHKILLMTPLNELTEASRVEKEVKGEHPDSNRYPDAFVRLFKKINDLANKHPGSKRPILELINNHLTNYIPGQKSQLLGYLSHFILTLENTFQELPSSLVLALCVEYNKDTPNLGPKELLEIVAQINQALPNKKQRLLVLKAIILSAQDEVYDKADIEKLIALLQNNQGLGDSLTQIFNQVPVPPLKKLLEHTDITSLEAFCETYRKNPCPRDLDNGFKVEKANEQLGLFRIYKQAPPQGQLEEKKPEVALVNSQEFSKKSLDMHELSNDELLEIFRKYNPKNNTYDKDKAQDLDTLVAVAAELLYRSKGKEVRDAKGELIPGYSMEINTTQYLAVLSFLKKSPHVTAQIGTGEGKSRITAIVNACLLAQGKTVDSATSDIQLATRDFLEFQPYFDLLGVQTAMIYSDSSPNEYVIGGLNVSDVPSLSQFRNMARSQNEGNKVIDTDSSNRALVLDEADKLLYDLTHNHFNISRESDKAIKGMRWVYPLLMDYFAQESVSLDDPIQGKNTIPPVDLYYEDIALSSEKFKQFAAGRCKPAELKRLNALSDNQIEQWQVSAVTANALKFKVDFDIEADTLVQTAEGLKFSSQALIRFENQVIKNSTYSFGVHSCLHARLNTLRNNPAAVKEPLLKEALSTCESSFHIPEEKQIVYSSTSQDLLDDYKDGVTKALTGTSGSPIERSESQQMGMEFIDVPRHRGLNRKDRATRLTANEKQQRDTILAEIKAGIAKNQPLLIVAEDDLESAAIFKDLQTKLAGTSATLRYIDSQTSDSDFKDITKKPGAPGEIIVSTNRIGRGTDFKLMAEAKQHGYKIIGTYLPSPRDTEQFFGRAGRYGDAGEALLILDKQRLKQHLGKSSLTDGYYTNPEAYIAHQQALINVKEQRERLLIQHTLSPFKKEIRDHYFGSLFSQVSPIDFSKLEKAWADFEQNNTQSWNSMWPKIQTELAKNVVHIEHVNNLLTEYRNGVLSQWTALITKLGDEIKITSKDGSVINPGDYLKAQDIPALAIKPDIRALLSYSRIPVLNQKKVYDYYDVNHEGRHTQYKHWYIPTIASLKGFANLLPLVHFENARRPFANIRAWMEDHGQLFTDFRANPHKGKILGVLISAVLLGGLGAALTAAGFTAPLGISLLGLSASALSLITYTAGGLLAGGLIGLSIGAVIDDHKKSSDRIGNKGPGDSPGSSYLKVMDGTGKVVSPSQTTAHQPPSGRTFSWGAEKESQPTSDSPKP